MTKKFAMIKIISNEHISYYSSPICCIHPDALCQDHPFLVPLPLPLSCYPLPYFLHRPLPKPLPKNHPPHRRHARPQPHPRLLLPKTPRVFCVKVFLKKKEFNAKAQRKKLFFFLCASASLRLCVEFFLTYLGNCLPRLGRCRGQGERKQKLFSCSLKTSPY